MSTIELPEPLSTEVIGGPSDLPTVLTVDDEPSVLSALRRVFRTQGINALVEAARGAGLRIDTQGGKATPIPPGLLGALIADPNNLFVSLFEPAPK